MKKTYRILSLLLAVLMICSTALIIVQAAEGTTEGLTFSGRKAEAVGKLYEETPYYVLVRHRQLGASHYAYTEALAEDLGSSNQDPEGSEAVFNPGSELVLVTIVDNGDGTYKTVEEQLLNSQKGVIRDPDVSTDGERILFSWKQSSVDDYHLYEMTLATREIKQLTFGSGAADIEGKYLSDGSIVFSSTRDIQSVDCWKTPVSNLYKMNGDGTEILRLGYDQVHTTYPTVTSDGRIIYTRWDYNDRTQMWIQGVFQMFEDGTNQTELYGNNSNYPTTLMHTREIPGESGMYLSIASGHHTYQHGKLVTIDTTTGRNGPDAVDFVFNDGTRKQDNVDAFGQQGRQYKYPYAFSSDLFMYAAVDQYSSVNAMFEICVYDKELDLEFTFVERNGKLPCSQIVPVYTRDLFTRPSMVNYAKETGTFYVSNVYEGPAMEGIEPGTAKYLRVVELEFRSSSIGATFAVGSGTADPFSPIATGTGSWDVKTVLGVVPIEADGSALFTAPANTPMYFQLLDENGSVIQTMRSWTTLMPNETFSCVGCHEDKNIAPTVSGTVTMAMKKGVQQLQPDLWMESDHDPYSDADTEGFSFLKEVQPILDESCVVCHSNPNTALSMIGQRARAVKVLNNIIPEDAAWFFTTAKPADKWETLTTVDWNGAHAPFSSGNGDYNTEWDSGEIWVMTTFTGTYYDLNEASLTFSGNIVGDIEIYVNGKLIHEGSYDGKTAIKVDNTMRKAFQFGDNTISVHVKGSAFSLALDAEEGEAGVQKNFFDNLTDWEYIQGPSEAKIQVEGWITGEDDSTKWKTAQAPFGDRNIDGIKWKTDWSGDTRKAIVLRKTFTVDDVSKFAGSALSTNITYDDSIAIYINGEKVFSDGGWVDSYVELTLAADASKVLKNGENIIAVSLINTAGGRQFDMSLFSFEKPEGTETVEPLDPSVGAAQFSLEALDILGARQKKYWPVSYLVLTSSYQSGSNWFATSDGDFVNFLSSMSVPEIITPYTFGSSKSLLIDKLRSGHGNLTEEQIRTIECWIDLVVPCYGAYDENVVWDNNAQREFEEKENKREYYDNRNKAVIDSKAGVYTAADTVKIEFYEANKTLVGTSEGEGYALLNVEGAYESRQSVKITLPEGQKYVAVGLNSRMGETIVYCPNGVFEYKFPVNMANVYPTTLNAKKDIVYINNVISARIPTEDELTASRNLAQNVYDLKDAKNQYPHASTNSVADNNAIQYESRNAIDGFTANLSHGTWPVQSWGPDKATMNKNYITVDFGRDVKLDSLEIIIRCDFPHDTWFTGAEVTLSDGTKKHIDMYKTEDAMVFDMGGVTTSSIKLDGFTTAGTEWAAITEIRAIGSDIIAE
ncbi:MAG: hypothetical protein IJ037_09450 [Clostridia bacterium]|nr:hypothetical protein [Clostridia bacterium]